jgi:enoyl-CoA hydratase
MLLTTQEGPVATVLFSNPAKFNAMTLDMWQALPARLQALEADPAVRCIVLRGEGEAAFVSGADISQFKDKRTDPAQAGAYAAAVEAAYHAPTLCTKPVIAAISGICMGGGLGLAAACDLRLGALGSRFRMPAARMGIGYSPMGIKRFVDIIGVQRTADLFMTARTFSAEDALSMGFLAEITAPDQIFSRANELAYTIAGNAPLTLKAFKLALNHVLDDTPKRPSEGLLQAIAACAASQDYQEGQRAFAEKRAPRFKGQ